MSHGPMMVAVLLSALVACKDPAFSRSARNASLALRAAATTAHAEDPSPRRQYGPPVQVGGGTARTYVVYAPGDSAVPLEVGVALDEGALDKLPKPNPHAAHMAPSSEHEHLDNHVYLLSLPKAGVAPYQFVELDWNPGGHEPPGVYDTPHFDFHFYSVPQADRAAIVPSDAQFQRKADMLPGAAQRPPFYVVAAPPGAPAPGVPLMGVHWVDVRSPELQKMFGKPDAYRPFTATFLYGSWAGRFIFLEPMITREHILAKKTAIDPAVRDQIVPLALPMQVSSAGYYPAAYRIMWESKAKEYRIALTQLARRG